MIESTVLPPEATQYLNDLQSQPVTDPRQEALTEAAISRAKGELLSWCQSFISKSKAWRAASYEEKWRLYQNNCDSILESSIANAKESWQSKAFVPMTASHKETIKAHVFKVLAGVQPPLDVEPRFDLGEADQSLNIRDITTRELEKAKWAVEFDSALDDAETFGSGFMRLYHEERTAKRKMRKEVLEGFGDNIDGLNPMGMIGYAKRAINGKRKVVAYEDKIKEVVTYRGLCIQYRSIWDVFPDPKAIKIPGSTIGLRMNFTYGDLVAGAKKGYYFGEAVDKLRGVKASETFPQGQREVQADRDIQDSSIDRTDYGMVHEGFELFGKFPQKWINAINGIEITDPEELVAARVIFHPLAVIAVELSDEYDQEPPLLKLDYFPKNGSFYKRGVAEMLIDLQRITNEIVNQRLDSGSILLNRSFGVIEQALTNPKQDLKQKPGQFIRFKQSALPQGDIRGGLMELSMNDTPVRAGFSEVNEAERWAQERTSANRVTMGTQGLVKDNNKTLGGQEIAREAAGDKFSYIGLMMELAFLQDLFLQVWKITYAHITPEDVENAIGPERAAKFILISPEEIQRDYVYKPLGVFTVDNKFKRQSALQAIRDQFKGMPIVNDEKFFDKIMQLADEDPDSFKYDESEILAQQANMIGTDQAPLGPNPQGEEVGPKVDLTGTPM